MPVDVIDWMEQRNWGFHHLSWHGSRSKDQLSAPSQAWLDEAHAMPLLHQGEAGSGLEFLAMHRMMVRSLRDAFPTYADSYLRGWVSVPQDPNIPLDEKKPENPYSPEFDGGKANALTVLRDSLSQFANDDALGRFIESEACPAIPIPGETCPDPRRGIHDYLHLRFSNGESGINMDEPLVNIGNQRFWRLHGWIDRVWDQFRRLKKLPEDDPAYQRALREAGHHMAPPNRFRKEKIQDLLTRIPPDLRNFFSRGKLAH